MNSFYHPTVKTRVRLLAVLLAAFDNVGAFVDLTEDLGAFVDLMDGALVDLDVLEDLIDGAFVDFVAFPDAFTDLGALDDLEKLTVFDLS